MTFRKKKMFVPELVEGLQKLNLASPSTPLCSAQGLFFSLTVFLLILVSFGSRVYLVAAHPLDVAYADFSASSSSALTLTSALHPYQAFTLVRHDPAVRLDLVLLREQMDTVEAYVEDHLTISRGGEECVWQVQKQDVPKTELEAVADGVTLSGEVSCPSSDNRLTVSSSIFVDGFPGQTTVLRLELPDGFAERGVLDRSHSSRELDITELYTSPSLTATVSGTEMMSRGDARLSRLADALQNPNNGWKEYLALLLAAFVIGMLHALGPGHGKALIAATLVGEQATFRRLLALGTVMTVTHVSDVFLLALLADAATALIAPTKIFFILQTVSAAGLVLFGGVQIVRAVLRYRMVRMNPVATESEEAHMRAHALGLPHGHGASEHEHHHDTIARAATCHDDVSVNRLDGGRAPHAPTFKHALWTGFIGSLAPCPTAWAIFLAALSLGKLGLGIGLLIAFTIGLHVTIMVLGLLILWSRAFAIRHTPPAIVYILPIFSAMIITGLGLFLLFR